MERHISNATRLTQQERFALITGAGKGLGRAYSIELARRGYNVLLTALPGEDLGSFCNTLQQTYGVQAASFECDLTREEGINALANWAQEHYRIHMLINNAGMGGTEAFMRARPERINAMILLNVRAMAMLTHRLLPHMQKEKRSWILNVSSIASFSAIGYKTVYPATKVFVTNFSRGLCEELRGSGVMVSVVHPGPMKTNADTALRIERQGWKGRICAVSPELMARRSLDRMFRNDALILIGWVNKLNWLLMKTIPVFIRLPLITRLVKKEIDRVDTKKRRSIIENEHKSNSGNPGGKARTGHRGEQLAGDQRHCSLAG